ncbi:MAG: hypothetical protein JSU74_11080 [Candidatus Zixiibacteriota bacterium]|nr:MAG: hypothetical protein JSU74_11080 [candidate division Zixibacteria bacterium]
MGIFDFFTTLADNFRNHYLELAHNSSIRQLRLAAFDQPEHEVESPCDRGDSYEPSNYYNDPAVADENAACDQPNTAGTMAVDPDEPAAEEGDTVGPEQEDPVSDETAPPQPYRFRHHTHFDYEVRLEFQLRAIASIAQEIAEGEPVSLEELAAAGFGLKAAMDISGKQIVEAGGHKRGFGDGHLRETNLLKARSASNFTYHTRDFALESFSRETLRIQRSMDVKTGESYQRAVNKFALRYRMDDSFSFAMLNRFNVQTERMAQTDQANLEPYTESAGDVAECGTTEMMAVFFDAVDAYLDQAEQQLLSRADEFFTLVARELGFSEEALAFSRDQAISTIESFFTRVDEAVSGLESHFIGESSPELLPGSKPAVPEFYEPVTEQIPSTVATA